MVKIATVLDFMVRKGYSILEPKLLQDPNWSGLAGSLDRLGKTYYERRENRCYIFSENGERWLLEQLSKAGSLDVVLDVGANSGEYAMSVLRCNNDASIHCFEICKPTFEKLKRGLSTLGNVTINDFGLAARDGEIIVHYCAGRDTLSSTVAVVCSGDTEQIVARIRHGKGYLEEMKIDRVDLLKIDVEGGDYDVLLGFAEFLDPLKIPVIQFEYGMVNIESGNLLKDFYELLSSKGYCVGKLYPNYVNFKKYEYSDENFLGPNYVAASEDFVALLGRNQP